MRVGLIGLGFISRFYLAALLPTGTLAAVCDVRPEALARFRDATPEAVPCWLDHRELIAAGGIDAAVVTVPNDLHAPVCHDLLDAGIPVCVEKPLATRLDDGLALVELAAARGTVLFTSFHRRYNAHLRALVRGLPPGMPVTSVRVRYLERIEEHVGDDRWYLDPRRCGGGCLADNGPNAFDLVRTILGPLEVSGVDLRRDATGLDRRATVELVGVELVGVDLVRGSAVPATVELDWNHPGETKDVEVRLADGTVRHADLLAGFPGFKRSLWHEYAGVLHAFARAVHTGEPDPHGLAALRLVDTAYRTEDNRT